MHLELLAGRNGSDQPAQVACATGKSFTHHGKGTAFSLYRKRLARPPLPRALNARAQDWAGAHRLHTALGLRAHFRNVNTGAAVFFFQLQLQRGDGTDDKRGKTRDQANS